MLYYTLEKVGVLASYSSYPKGPLTKDQWIVWLAYHYGTPIDTGTFRFDLMIIYHYLRAELANPVLALPQ